VVNSAPFRMNKAGQNLLTTDAARSTEKAAAGSRR
jgi:hypothetical protein